MNNNIEFSLYIVEKSFYTIFKIIVDLYYTYMYTLFIKLNEKERKKMATFFVTGVLLILLINMNSFNKSNFSVSLFLIVNFLAFLILSLLTLFIALLQLFPILIVILFIALLAYFVLTF